MTSFCFNTSGTNMQNSTEDKPSDYCNYHLNINKLNWEWKPLYLVQDSDSLGKTEMVKFKSSDFPNVLIAATNNKATQTASETVEWALFRIK